MSRTSIWIAAAALTMVWTGAIAHGADRMTDRELLELLQQIDQGRDRFEGALPGELKASIVRTPTGEVDVGRYLNDFDRSIDELKDRIRPEYAASTEASTVLRQASAIDAYLKAQPPGTPGGSEWISLTRNLRALASAYGTSFPIAEPTTIRRLSRKELAASADTTARAADQFKKSLDNDLKRDPTMDKTTRESIVRDADQLKKDAEAVRSRVDDDEPSTAEADRLFTRAQQMQQYVEGREFPTADDAWSRFAPGLRDLAGAYKTTW